MPSRSIVALDLLKMSWTFCYLGIPHFESPLSALPLLLIGNGVIREKSFYKRERDETLDFLLKQKIRTLLLLIFFARVVKKLWKRHR